MSRHIIRPFQAVGIKSLVFGNKTVKNAFKVDPDRGIIAFIDRKASRGVKDKQVQSSIKVHKKAGAENEIGAPLQGQLSGILVEAGQEVKAGQPLFLIEAMKMSNTITAPADGKVKKIWLEAGVMVEQDDLVVELS